LSSVLDKSHYDVMELLLKHGAKVSHFNIIYIDCLLSVNIFGSFSSGYIVNSDLFANFLMGNVVTLRKYLGVLKAKKLGIFWFCRVKCTVLELQCSGSESS
jgi:hypothetical protein